jgi:hypothetical protein
MTGIARQYPCQYNWRGTPAMAQAAIADIPRRNGWEFPSAAVCCAPDAEIVIATRLDLDNW